MRRVLILLGILFAPLLETSDSAIVNVALPTIQGNLGATIDESAWVITSNIIANVIIPLQVRSPFLLVDKRASFHLDRYAYDWVLCSTNAS